MTYAYVLARRAERYFDRLPKRQQRAISETMTLVCTDPFDPRFSIPMQGRQHGIRRARVGDLRILFEVHEQIEILEVTDIGPRGDIYKG